MAAAPNANMRKVHLSRAFHAFSDRNYRLLWPANFISYTSRWMQMTLLSWLVLELTYSPWRVALVGFSGMAPMLFLGLVGGVLADSVDRQKLITATQGASLIAGLVMTVLLSTGLVRYWHAYPIILAMGTAWALDMPSRRSLIQDLLGRSGVTNAIALDSMGMSASRMFGPALAGVLIIVAGVTGGYVVVTLFHFVVVSLVLRLKLSQARRGYRASAGVAGNLFRGLRYVGGHRILLATVLVTVTVNMLLLPYISMVPVIARDVLDVGPGLMGALLAADGLGAMVGAMLIASAVNIRYHGRLYLGGSMVALLALMLFSFSDSYILSFPALLVLGLGMAGFSTMQPTLVMLLATEEMRGRALGVISVAIGAAPLGALFIGGVATAVSPTFAIALNAALGIAGLALIGLFMPSLRQRIVPEARRPA